MSNHGDQYRLKAVAKWTPRIHVRADRFERAKIVQWCPLFSSKIYVYENLKNLDSLLSRLQIPQSLLPSIATAT